MHIGSWDDKKRLSGTQFSRIFEMTGARERITIALNNHLRQNNFDGLLISWYYPVYNRVSFEICVKNHCNNLLLQRTL